MSPFLFKHPQVGLASADFSLFFLPATTRIEKPLKFVPRFLGSLSLTLLARILSVFLRASQMMKESGVIWVPTLAAYSGAITLLSKKVAFSQASLQFNGSTTHLRGELKELRIAEDRWERMKRAFKLGVEVDVTIGELYLRFLLSFCTNSN